MHKFHILKIIKNIIIPLLVLIIYSCSEQKEVHVSDTIMFSGKLYKSDQKEPFTGIVYNTYPNEKRQYEGEYQKGIPHGMLIYWFDSGVKKREGELQQGQPIGRWKEFNEDGTIKSQVDH